MTSPAARAPYHHVIIVTTWNDNYSEPARAEAVSVFGHERVSAILEAPWSSEFTFFIGPCGSTDDDTGAIEASQAQRAHFISWLDGQRYMNGDSKYSWVAVKYGAFWGDPKIVAHSKEDVHHLPDGSDADDDAEPTS